MTKLLIATQDTFTKNATYKSRGEVVSSDEVDWKEGDPGFIAAPSGVDANAVVEVAAIAPTGPNPRNPQQIAPGTVQTAGGYVDQGAVLVGEVTAPMKVRITDAGLDKDDDTQAAVTEALEKFDHDGKNGPGGSLKGAASTAAKGAAKRNAEDDS